MGVRNMRQNRFFISRNHSLAAFRNEIGCSERERTEPTDWENKKETKLGSFYAYILFFIIGRRSLGQFDSRFDLNSVNRTKIKETVQASSTREHTHTHTAHTIAWLTHGEKEILGGFWLMDTFEMLVINFTLIRLLTISRHTTTATAAAVVLSSLFHPHSDEKWSALVCVCWTFLNAKWLWNWCRGLLNTFKCGKLCQKIKSNWIICTSGAKRQHENTIFFHHISFRPIWPRLLSECIFNFLVNSISFRILCLFKAKLRQTVTRQKLNSREHERAEETKFFHRY